MQFIGNTGTLQGCVLGPVLYTLFTYDCVATHESLIIKFTEESTVKALISGSDETAYRTEVASNIARGQQPIPEFPRECPWT